MLNEETGLRKLGGGLGTGKEKKKWMEDGKGAVGGSPVYYRVDC